MKNPAAKVLILAWVLKNHWLVKLVSYFFILLFSFQAWSVEPHSALELDAIDEVQQSLLKDQIQEDAIAIEGVMEVFIKKAEERSGARFSTGSVTQKGLDAAAYFFVRQWMKKIALILLMFMMSVSAFADQCAYNGRFVSQAARAILVNHDFIYQFCELCGDKAPQEYPIYSDNAQTIDKKAIHFRDRGDDGQGKRFWEFEINKGYKDGSAQNLDLAYTYVHIGGSLVNVGAILNCLKDGVKSSVPDATPVIKFNPAKIDCSATGACG